MKKLLLLCILGLSLMAKDSPEEVKPKILEYNDYYLVICIRGYEFVQDINGNLEQIFESTQYKLSGIDHIPIQLPVKCKDTK